LSSSEVALSGCLPSVSNAVGRRVRRIATAIGDARPLDSRI